MKNVILLSMTLLVSLIGNSQCSASFTYSILNGTVTFTNTSTGTGAFTNHYWTFGDGASASSQNVVHTYSAIGAYTVCLNVFDSITNCQSTYCDSLFITSLDTTITGPCTASAVISSDSNGIVGVNTSTGASFYEWTVFSGGTFVYTSTSTNLNYSPTTSGNYMVCLITYDSLQNFCDSLCENIFFPVDSNLAVGINEVNFSIYPNPVDQFVTIEVDDIDNYTFVLTDLTGREMQRMTAITEKVTLDFSGYTSGIYLLNALNSSGQVVHSRQLRKN